MAKTPEATDPQPSLAVPFVVPTKLRPPHVKSGLLQRPDLLERLRAGRETTLTLVCAPAGYGKTTLLAQWAADAGPIPIVWVSLDTMDSDPARLWSHVVTALQQVHSPAGEKSLTAFAAGPSGFVEKGLPLLVEELSAFPPVVVVLDDWHTVASRACDETVGAFVDRAPEAIQIVISSRHDPLLPIARLRAHGDLTELRARDLSVSSTQANALFQEADVRLATSDVEKLTERTEGWLAGLTLAALVLREQADPRRFVDDFSGDSRTVFDYLARDVVDTANPDVRDFMVYSSVLPRLSAPLCDAVLERSDSASMLAEIERSNLFLVALDAVGSEYRYHHLLSAVLARRLESVDPESLAGLHARASTWFEEHGDVEHAVEHAIAGRDTTRASALVTRAAIPFLSFGRMTTVNRWFDSLSWPEAQRDRELAIVRALSAMLSGHGREEVERWLRIAEDGPDFGPLANGITSIRSAVAMVSSTYLSRGIADAELAARLVLEVEPAGSEWRYAGLVPLGQALFLGGRSEEARAPLEEARRLSGARRRATTLLAIAYLSLIELAGGEVERSESLARDGVALAEELGHATTAAGANAHLALGCALMAGTDLHSAIDHLERAVQLASVDESSYWEAHARIHLGAARHLLGDSVGARDALGRARAGLDELPDVGMLGELYWKTDDALRHRPRHEGFLGEGVSEAERRVLDLLLAGLSVSQAAGELWLSPNTVKTHRRNIYRKLGATNRAEMIERATVAGILEPTASDSPPGATSGA